MSKCEDDAAFAIGMVLVKYGAWLLIVLLSPALATLFWLLWNWLAPVYFYWLPSPYQAIPWWHCVGLFWLMPLMRLLVWPGMDVKVKPPKAREAGKGET